MLKFFQILTTIFQILMVKTELVRGVIRVRRLKCCVRWL